MELIRKASFNSSEYKDITGESIKTLVECGTYQGDGETYITQDNARFLANQIVILDQPTQQANDDARARLDATWGSIS